MSAITSTIWTSFSVTDKPEGSALDIESIWRAREFQLKQFRRYGDDWDGFGADAPDPILIDVSIAYLKDLKSKSNQTPPTNVSLAPDGSVSIAWQTPEYFNEARIVSYELVEWMSSRLGWKPEFWEEQLSSAMRRPRRYERYIWQESEENTAGAAASV